MKSLFFILLIIFIIKPAHAQMFLQYLEKNKNYSIARIWQKDNTAALKVRNLKLSNDTILLFDDREGASFNQTQLSTKNVTHIKVKKGTYAGDCAKGLGSSCFLFALGVLKAGVNYNSYLYTYSEINWANFAKFCGGLTVGGIFVGALIGAFIPKWETLYINDYGYSFTISPDVYKDYYSIGLTFKF